MVTNFCFFKLAITHNKWLPAKNAFILNVFQILPVFQEFTGKKAALIQENWYSNVYIEEAIPLRWTPTIESLVFREKQYLKTIITVFKKIIVS